MKRLLTIACFLLITIGVVGCGQKEKIVDKTNNPKVEEKSKVEIKEDEKINDKIDDKIDEDKTEAIINEPVKDIEVVESNKGIYLEKIKQVEESMVDLVDFYAGITVEQKYATAEEYSRWDNLINEIYGVLREEMPTNDFEKLENEQINWISEKDPKAREASKKYEGGTQYEVEYAATLGQLTKERCNYLVNKYMK